MKRLVYFCEKCKKEIQDPNPVKIVPVYIVRSPEKDEVKSEVFKVQADRHYCMSCAMDIMEYAEKEPAKPSKDRLKKFEEILDSVDAGNRKRTTGSGGMVSENDTSKKNKQIARATAGVKKKVMTMYLAGSDYEQIKKSTHLTTEQIEEILLELDAE